MKVLWYICAFYGPKSEEPRPQQDSVVESFRVLGQHWQLRISFNHHTWSPGITRAQTGGGPPLTCMLLLRVVAKPALRPLVALSRPATWRRSSVCSDGGALSPDHLCALLRNASTLWSAAAAAPSTASGRAHHATHCRSGSSRADSSNWKDAPAYRWIRLPARWDSDAC
jgi:hypothetical protein